MSSYSIVQPLFHNGLHNPTITIPSPFPKWAPIPLSSLFFTMDFIILPSLSNPHFPNELLFHCQASF
jgi:hypothetical protein